MPSQHGFRVKIPGSNPSVVTRAPTLSFDLGRGRSAADSAVSVWIRRGGPSCCVDDEDDAGGGRPGEQASIIEIGEADSLCSADGGLVRALGLGCLSLGTQAGGEGITIGTGVVTVRQPTLSACNLLLSGSIAATRYENLITGFSSANPFVPPSAAALNLTFMTLSNLISANAIAVLSAVGSNGGGTSYGTYGTYGGALSNALAGMSVAQPSFVTDAPSYGPTVDFGLLSCFEICVADGGWIVAPAYSNLVDDYVNVATHTMPPSAWALNDAYTRMSNAAASASVLPPFLWTNGPGGGVLASLDSNGVFTPSGGYGGLPVRAMSSDLLVTDSNVAASCSALGRVRSESIAMSSVTFVKAQSACNIANAVATVAAAASGSSPA